VLLTLIEQMTYAGRMGGAPLEAELAALERLESAAKQLGHDDELRTAVGVYYRMRLWELYFSFTQHVRLTDKAVPFSESLWSLGRGRHHAVEFPSRRQIDSAIHSSEGSLSEGAQAKLDAYLDALSRFGPLATPGRITEASSGTP
jgi:hypothetical protein